MIKWETNLPNGREEAGSGRLTSLGLGLHPVQNQKPFRRRAEGENYENDHMHTYNIPAQMSPERDLVTQSRWSDTDERLKEL